MVESCFDYKLNPQRDSPKFLPLYVALNGWTTTAENYYMYITVQVGRGARLFSILHNWFSNFFIIEAGLLFFWELSSTSSPRQISSVRLLSITRERVSYRMRQIKIEHDRAAQCGLNDYRILLNEFPKSSVLRLPNLTKRKPYERHLNRIRAIILPISNSEHLHHFVQMWF